MCVCVLACVYLCRNQNQCLPLWLSAFIVLKQGLLPNLEFIIFRYTPWPVTFWDLPVTTYPCAKVVDMLYHIQLLQVSWGYKLRILRKHFTY